MCFAAKKNFLHGAVLCIKLYLYEKYTGNDAYKHGLPIMFTYYYRLSPQECREVN